MPFSNPYNFVPAPPRGEGGQRLPDGLRDGAPAGHHRWHPELWSGRIPVETVRTPLLLPRTRPSGDSAVPEHLELDVATAQDADGVERVDLAPTQIKGMLRSAFEAVTCSRMGIFGQHEVLGYRSGTGGATSLRPALVHGEDRVELLGDLTLDRRRPGSAAAVPVRAWDRAGSGRTWRLRDLAHRDVVDARIAQDGAGRWHTDEIRRAGASEWIRLSDEPGGNQPFVVRGILHAPGASIKDKRSERIFVTEVLEGQERLVQHRSRRVPDAAARDLVADLETLVRHQRTIHRHAGRDEILERAPKGPVRSPWEYLGDDPGATAWSRHLFDVGDGAPPRLGPDTTIPPAEGAPVPCWAEPDPDVPGGVRRLRPVMISRLLHKASPADLLDPSLHPASALDRLSAADRVFGWVAPRSEGRGVAAHRGQLRVVGLQCPEAARAVDEIAELTLPPLSTPKPSQGRFYLGTPDRDGVARPLGPEVERGDMFRRGQVLRGRKVYPHQQWFASAEREVSRRTLQHRPQQGRALKDSQNATIHQWVSVGSVFRFELDVRDLHPTELGALMWLLDPDRYGLDGTPGLHRLGWGKPFGFGSVELRAVAGETRLRTGAQEAERLRSLGAEDTTSDPSALAGEFESAMAAQPATKKVIRAVRIAAVGYSADTAVHYPRTAPGKPCYEWFVENEAAANDGCAQSLPLLGGLPLKETP